MPTFIQESVLASVLFDCLGNRTHLFYVSFEDNDVHLLNLVDPDFPAGKPTDYDVLLLSRIEENHIYGLGSTIVEEGSLPANALPFDSFAPTHRFTWLTGGPCTIAWPS